MPKIAPISPSRALRIMPSSRQRTASLSIGNKQRIAISLSFSLDSGVNFSSL
ncbi:Uncharacterised protein [Vibrio cholerae]|nr:Uncharacterised protein [Vibrio cholerae]